METEKQKFLMEIMDIMNGQNSNELIVAVEILVREAIRTQARQGGKMYNIPVEQMHMNMNGVAVIVRKETIVKLVDNLREEGFQITEPGNGYYSIEW